MYLSELHVKLRAGQKNAKISQDPVSWAQRQWKPADPALGDAVTADTWKELKALKPNAVSVLREEDELGSQYQQDGAHLHEVPKVQANGRMGRRRVPEGRQVLRGQGCQTNQCARLRTLFLLIVCFFLRVL
jgi:hypothetical protein